jgi:large subunit ribosomal protein L10
MSKFIKNHIIAELESELEGRSELLVVDMSKMSGTAANELRVQLSQKDIHLLTVKNSLVRRACERLGIQGLDASLCGSSTLIWGGEDIVALSREITKWAKDAKELEIKGGTVEGQALDSAGVDRLSKSPGRPELLSRIAGLILSPGGNIAGALLGPGGLVSGAIKSKAEGEGE